MHMIVIVLKANSDGHRVMTNYFYKTKTTFSQMFAGFFCFFIFCFHKALSHPIWWASEAEAYVSSGSWALSGRAHLPQQRDQLGLEYWIWRLLGIELTTEPHCHPSQREKLVL